MASSEVINSLPSNGQINNVEDADNSVLNTSANQGVSETSLEEVHSEPHDEPRSAQLEGTVQSPVLDNLTASQPYAPSSKGKGKSTGPPIKPSPPTSQTTTGKALLSGPPTPQVKKILSSGKFGTGVAKAVPPPASKTADAPATGKVSMTPQVASTLKPATSSNPAVKSPTSTLAPSSKTAMPPKSSAVPTRRTSLVPSKTPTHLAKSSSLSASVSGKSSSVTSPPTVAKPTSTVPARPPITSPDSTVSAKSAATPRPRVSEAPGPKKSQAPRTSLAPHAKLSGTTTARPSRTPGAGSISSLKEAKEVKEDGAALAEMQNKLDETMASLDTKSSTISELETQIEDLKASLTSKIAELEAGRENLENAELAKATTEKELLESREALAMSQADGDKLQQVLNELEAAKTIAAEQNALVESLREQINTLQAEVETTKESLEAHRAVHANHGDFVAAAEMDRQALDQARADFEAIKTEITALKAAHTAELDTATAKITTLEPQASRAESLAAEIASLRDERQETANKLSELEVEILELKEAQDLAEEKRKTSEAQINTLRDEARIAAEATNIAFQEVATKESAAAEQLEDIKKQHTEALALAAEECSKLTEQLGASQAEIGELREKIEALHATAASAAEEHTRHLEEAERAHQVRQDEQTAEIERISAELGAQEALYNAKVQTVKDEHDRLLQQAFERAKNEAGEAHSQDLQTLRENSEVAIEQLRTSHQATVDGLKIDHEAELASQAQAFQKQLSSQSLELKATAEDLAKAKSARSTSVQEIEALRVQLDEAHQAARAAAETATADRDADVVRLTKELSNARDDLSALNEALRATQESMQEMGRNHQLELEEAAKGRTEEVSKLRAAHDSEIQALVTDKASLLTRLSDLEGELFTARASAAPAEVVASPKRNGLSTAPIETVTKEELQSMHEAHNLKINDLQAEHEKAMRALQEEVEAAQAKISGTVSDLERKNMEIMYLEQEQEESQDQITRLKEDVERLTEELSSKAE